MDNLNTISLGSNNCFKMNYNGRNLSSNADLLIIYDFMQVMGVENIISKTFSTPLKDSFRKHSDSSMLRFLYQVFAAYFTDDYNDHLRKNLLFTRIVDKYSLTIPANAFPLLEPYGQFHLETVLWYFPIYSSVK